MKLMITLMLVTSLLATPSQADPVDCSQPSGENLQCHAEAGKCRVDAFPEGNVRVLCQPSDGKSRCWIYLPSLAHECMGQSLP